MRRNPDSVGFNKIFILQHLRPGDRRTGEEIERVIKYSSIKRTRPVLCELIEISSRIRLFDVLDQIKQLVSTEPLAPYIHFEFHGCKEGLEISNDLVSWTDLKTPLLEINRGTRNNLFISVATCYGAYLFRVINLREPCPFYGYIGPDNEIESEELEINYSAYFESLLKEGSFDAAISCLNDTIAMRNGTVKYSYLNCYGLFDMKASEFATKFSTAQGRNALVNAAISNARLMNPRSNLSINQLRREAKNLLRSNWHLNEMDRLKRIFTHEIKS